MTLIPELERELEAMVGRQVAPAPRRRLSRRRLAVAIVLAVLLAATAALAAGGVIPIGAPAHDPPDALKPKPNTMLGVVRPGAAKVLPLRVADPDGGPPWGVRLSVTTRGLGCLQSGRVVDGRIGALGQDGVFHDDGRFHPFSANYQLIGAACAQLDGARRLFSVGSLAGIPAAGTTGEGACYLRGSVTGDPSARFCPDEDERDVAFGTLGPNARSITYRGEDGQIHTQDLVRPYGAYLLVRHHTPSGEAGGSGASWLFLGDPRPNPSGTAITKVTFDDGRTCTVTPLGWASARPGRSGSCPFLGYRERPRPKLTTADVRSPVRVSLEHRRGERVMVVRWRARVAIADASATYWVSRRRIGARGWGAGPTRRNLRKGEIAEQVFWNPVRGTYRVHVAYVWAGAGPQSGRSLQVGTTVVHVPTHSKHTN